MRKIDFIQLGAKFLCCIFLKLNFLLFLPNFDTFYI